jgi:hypothetical protein
MKYLLSLAMLLCTLQLSAQDGEKWEPVSEESLAYHQYRTKNTVPPYGLEKVKKLVAGIGIAEDDAPNRPAAGDYAALSLREKFTYHMIHAEVYSQNCDAIPLAPDEHKKIFGLLPDAFGEHSWSQRQYQFLRDNRDSVMSILTESVTRSKRVGLNYKHAIVAINGREMIPFLIKTYNTGKKDHDILTVLLLLMKNNAYQPLLTSASYPKLYGDGTDFRAHINFNAANEALILERAVNFHNNR